MNSEALAAELAEVERRYSGRLAVEVRRLDGEGGFALREREVLPAASTVKLFVLCELFRQAEAGLVDLGAPLAARPEHWCPGDGLLRAMRLPQELSVHNMAVMMIALSDNAATAALVEHLGAENVERTMRSWGLEDTTVAEGLADWARGSGPGPASSARDLCWLLERVFRQEVLSPAGCSEVIGIMRAQRINDMLPRCVPVGEDWGDAEEWIASKTGYGRCTVETGIVHARAAKLCLAVFFRPEKTLSPRCKCLADHPPVLAVAAACRAIWEHAAPGASDRHEASPVQ
jgi:beta-lactamase class A